MGVRSQSAGVRAEVGSKPRVSVNQEGASVISTRWWTGPSVARMTRMSRASPVGAKFVG